MGISWMVYAGFIFFRAQRIHLLPYDLRRALVIGALLAGTVLLAPHLHVGPWQADVLLKTCVGFVIVCVIFTIALPGWQGKLRHLLRPAA